MFYDDVRSLKQIYTNALEDSGSEVAPGLLLDISAISLRCASKWLSAEQSYVWARALDTWNQHTRLASVLQNYVCGGTYFELEERKEILRKAADDAYQTLYRMEELLVDIGKVQNEETARRNVASVRTLAPGGTTPMRRTESTGAFIKTSKNWLTLVYQAREIVWKALDLGSDRSMLELVFKRSTFTRNNSTRLFVEKVLQALSQSRPGSWSDFRSPSWRLMLSFTRTEEQKALLHKVKDPAAPNQQITLSPISSAFSSSMMQFHYPFWDNPLVKTVRYTFLTGFGVISFVFLNRRNPELIPMAFYSSRAWFSTHLWEPFKAMAEDVFFNRSPKTSSRQAALEAQQSLERMLNDFRRDVGKDLNASNLKDVNEAYESAIVHPIRYALFGDLIRLGLIQAQALKTETLNLATELDDVIAENHFNSLLLATFPALGVLVFASNIVQRFYRWSRDETNSRDSARLEIRLALWDIEMLLIREDDGPSLYSFLTSDDRGSEAGASENWGQNPPATPAGGAQEGTIEIRRGSTGSNLGVVGIISFDEDDDLMHVSQYVEETLNIDPITRYRRQLAGQMICTLHHLINLLVRSRGVLFRGRDREWIAAMRDANFLFARDGWTARARLELARTLRDQLTVPLDGGDLTAVITM